MPKSKTNIKRKSKVQQFKTEQKAKFMSSKKPIFRPFNQIPVWDENAEFTLTGREFTVLKDFLGIFSEPMGAMQDIFTRHLNSGVITVRYEDNDGNEIPREEIEEQLKAFEAMMSSSKNPEEELGTYDHVLTQEDLNQNPEFVEEGLNVGGTIRIPIDEDCGCEDKE